MWLDLRFELRSAEKKVVEVSEVLIWGLILMGTLFAICVLGY